MNYSELLIIFMNLAADACKGPCFPIDIPPAKDADPVVVEKVVNTRPCMATLRGKLVPCAEAEKDSDDLLQRMQKFNEEVKK